MPISTELLLSYPRDAILEQYTLWPLCLYDRPSVTSRYCIETAARIKWFFAHRFISTYAVF